MVRITEDPVFGTPVFTTIGGQSKCPGETGTSRRQSSVNIVDIVPRCVATDSLCKSTNLNAGEKAHFGVVILNTSPTGMAGSFENFVFV